MVTIVNNIAGTAIYFFLRATYFLACNKNVRFMNCSKPHYPSCFKSGTDIVYTQVQILVGCQSWIIGPWLALLWRPRFGHHNWANCGSFGFTNFGSQYRLPKMCPTVSSTIAETRTDCRANFSELL